MTFWELPSFPFIRRAELCGEAGPWGSSVPPGRSPRSFIAIGSARTLPLHETVGGTHDGAGATVQHMGVDHRRADVPMSEQFLHGPDVVAVLEKVRGEGVAQGMA